jgi:cytochrome c oxidase accessory protein FixG
LSPRPATLAPVSAQVEVDLYEVRRTIHPRAVRGWFANWRIALVVLTQLVFYGTAWLTWNGRQAVLFDLAARKFYVFGMVFWPQDFIFLTALLVIAALSLFLFTAVAGRLWCGYACPQTVYTEIFMWIEHSIEGDRVQRIKLDGNRLDVEKLFKKTFKHLVWIAFALWTGFTFVGYFSPVRELMMAFLQTRLGSWETFWILFYGFATYGNAGWMREQVCKHMCPYARFQSVMFDADTLVITYDAQRGEPRGSRRKATNHKAAGLGSCVDCGICVQACPTSIDIRDGLQYECIGCAACIDGCDQVMDKMGYPRGLIRYATDNSVRGKYRERDILRRVLRPRTLIYSAILLATVTVFVSLLYLRVPLKVDVIRDRATLVRELSDGRFENVYRLQIMNTTEEAHQFTVTVSGIEGLQLIAVQPVMVGPASAVALPVALRVDPAQTSAGSHAVHFHVEAGADARIKADEKSIFYVR